MHDPAATPLFEQVQEAAAFIRSRWAETPEVGIILGTGLGNLVEDVTDRTAIAYGDIPHFPRSTAPTHKGQLVCGKLAGKFVAAMEGRLHFYEGWSLQQVAFPVRVMKALGCRTLIVSNASGGMNPQYSKGDLMLIEDHINLLGDNPLIGPNDERRARFPDMCQPYDRGLLQRARAIALREGVPCQQGVFVAVAGPNLETRAEYRFLRLIGADAVGMSTVPEVIVAVHAGLRVLGVSVITDLCLPDALQPVSLEEIVAVAREAEKKFKQLVFQVVAEM